MGVFMGAEDGSQEGWLRKYLIWERAEVRGDVSQQEHWAMQFGLTFTG